MTEADTDGSMTHRSFCRALRGRLTPVAHSVFHVKRFVSWGVSVACRKALEPMASPSVRAAPIIRLLAVTHPIFRTGARCDDTLSARSRTPDLIPSAGRSDRTRRCFT